MILEEIEGNVKVTMIKENGATVVVAVGDYISDHESSTLCVIGEGKAHIRVDPSCTFELRGKPAETAEAAPVAETPPAPPAPPAPPVEAPVESPKEAPEEPAAKK